MSATAETIKLGEYFQEYYGPPQNKYVCPPIIEVSKTYNHNVIKFHLEKLYSTIPSVSINGLKKNSLFPNCIKK